MTWHPRHPSDQDVQREIRDHLDLEAEERARQGLPTDQAERAARLAFGNPALVNEDVRAAVGVGPRRGDRARRAPCVATLGPQSRLLDHRGPHGRPRHRRQHCDCQPDQRRLLENASGVASVRASTRRLDLTTTYVRRPPERVRRSEDWRHGDVRNFFRIPRT